MSRLNPCTNSSIGAAASPAARTASSVPSNDAHRPEVVGRQVPETGPRGRDRSVGGARVRPTAPAAIAPAATPPAIRAVRLPVMTCVPRHGTAEARAHRSATRSRRRSCSAWRRELPRRHRLGPLRAQQHDLVAGSGLEVAAVHDQLVHRHAPRHAAPASPDQHVGRETTACEGSRRRSPPARSPPTRRARARTGGRTTPGGPRGSRLTKRHGRAPGERRAQAEVRRRRRERARPRRCRCPTARGRAGPPGSRSRPPCSPRAAGRDRGPARRTLSTTSANASSCRFVVTSSVSAHARCVHRPSSSSPAADDASTNAATRVGRPHADPVHAGVDLHVHADRRLRRGRRRRRPAAPGRPSVQTVGREARRRRRATSEPGGHSDSTRIGASMPACAQPEALLDEGDAEPGRAGLEGGPRDGDVAVPVGVGLHDRHQLAALERRARARCARSRRDRRRPRSGGRSRHARHRRRPRSGSAFDHVAGERALAQVVARRARPATPCTNAPAVAASSGSTPSCEQPADHAGQHVAGARGGERGGARSG